MIPAKPPRVPWTPEDNDAVRRAVAGELPVGELIDMMPHRTFNALRRRYVTFGCRPNEETRHRRMMAFGSAALRRALEKAHARSAHNREQ